MTPRHARNGRANAPRGGPPPQARPITEAEATRRRRAGVRVGRGSTGNGRSSMVWTETRNGVPWKPYVYRGAG